MEKQMRKIWKVRIKKAYQDATNHIAVGEVLEENQIYIKMRCRTFHFKKPTYSFGIYSSEIKTRIFPWQTISYITELSPDFEWKNVKVELTERGDVVLFTEKEDKKIGIKGGPQWAEM